MSEDDIDSAKAVALVNSICPLLADHEKMIQGLALADLLAIWLAGHYVEDDEAATLAAREALLVAHMDTVRQLTVINAKYRGTLQ